jgi:hypothetical protein
MRREKSFTETVIGKTARAGRSQEQHQQHQQGTPSSLGGNLDTEARSSTTCSVEIQVDGKVIRRYGAPFERAAMALAKEVLRRLSPGTGFRVVVQREMDTVQSWSATSDGWKASGPLVAVPQLA